MCFPSDSGEERGSAAVEFVLVGLLLVALVFAVIQVVFVTHLRSVAIDSAIAGAARAALADKSDAAGVERANELLELTVEASLIRGVKARSSETAGRPTVVIEVELAVPATGPWVPVANMTVSGSAFREDPEFQIQ